MINNEDIKEKDDHSYSGTSVQYTIRITNESHIHDCDGALQFHDRKNHLMNSIFHMVCPLFIFIPATEVIL